MAKKTKNSKKPGSGRKPRIVCSRHGCLKTALSQSDLCRKCVGDPVEASQRLTEIESLQFARADAELRNHHQGRKLLQYQINEVARNSSNTIAALEQQMAELKSMIESEGVAYEAMLRGLEKKYGITKGEMVVDPDTRIIRDLTRQ